MKVMIEQKESLEKKKKKNYVFIYIHLHFIPDTLSCFHKKAFFTEHKFSFDCDRKNCNFFLLSHATSKVDQIDRVMKILGSSL